MAKNQLRTVRFAPQEGGLVDTYLKQNPIFESFSALARVATLSFIGEEAFVHLQRIPLKPSARRPRFLWDYELTESGVREVLAQPGLSAQKRWLIERILRECRFEEVCSYLSLEMIKKALPQLRLLPKVRRRWEYALARWSTTKINHEQRTD